MFNYINKKSLKMLYIQLAICKSWSHNLTSTHGRCRAKHPLVCFLVLCCAVTEFGNSPPHVTEVMLASSALCHRRQARLTIILVLARRMFRVRRQRVPSHTHTFVVFSRPAHSFGSSRHDLAATSSNYGCRWGLVPAGLISATFRCVWGLYVQASDHGAHCTLCGRWNNK